MVRLAITDFATKEESDYFYVNEEYETSQNMFTYSAFKKYSAYLPKEDTSKFYSLNLLSKKYLDRNQFLIHIADEEFVILFNHKTIYSAKINPNFITDDMIKSILISKHITMLSSGGELDKFYYVINSKFRAALEVILKQNIKNEKREIIAQSLGDIEELVLPLKDLDTQQSHITKLSILAVLLGGSFWLSFFGLDMIKDKYLQIEPLEPLKQELTFEDSFKARQERSLNEVQMEYNKLTDCITYKEDLK
ncbi:hypothetical protein [Arcobacter vandammei]|uniref:hypothetical protein n=1 Tax=Arcobacter vandammei TaxID=2782243 RepID=UPI0018E03A40|nr:hypothetical protein [Arcobacter vandammei]